MRERVFDPQLLEERLARESHLAEKQLRVTKSRPPDLSLVCCASDKQLQSRPMLVFLGGTVFFFFFFFFGGGAGVRMFLESFSLCSSFLAPC